MGDERQDLCSLKSGHRGSPREGWGPGVREEAKKHIEGSQEARKYDWGSGRCGERKEVKVILTSPTWNQGMMLSDGSR